MAKERIRIKRKGVYGEGFLSEPQSEQYRKIDQVEKKESPELVHEQLSALHSFNSKNPRMRERAEKDLKYSEKTDPTKSGRWKKNKTRIGDRPIDVFREGGNYKNYGCKEGEYYVASYWMEDDTFVHGYCRKMTSRADLDPRDRDSDDRDKRV
jgi:hypothetical protein